MVVHAGSSGDMVEDGGVRQAEYFDATTVVVTKEVELDRSDLAMSVCLYHCMSLDLT